MLELCTVEPELTIQPPVQVGEVEREGGHMDVLTLHHKDPASQPTALP